MNTKKTDKEAYKFLKDLASKNAKCTGYEQRVFLLAYAFVRGIPYVALEKVINEDKFPNNGNLSFINSYLIPDAACWVAQAYGVKPISVLNDVKEWIMKKYETQKVAA